MQKSLEIDKLIEAVSVFFEISKEKIHTILESGILEDIIEGDVTQIKREEFRKLLGLPTLIANSELPMLDFIGVVDISIEEKCFIAKDSFAKEKELDTPVRISYVGDNFKKWFFEKKEVPVSKSKLRLALTRKKELTDEEIIKSLGDEFKAEISLSEIYTLMKNHSNNCKEISLNDTYTNIFYVSDISNILRSVSVSWFKSGWRVTAFPLDFSEKWSSNICIFSRHY